MVAGLSKSFMARPLIFVSVNNYLLKLFVPKCKSMRKESKVSEKITGVCSDKFRLVTPYFTGLSSNWELIHVQKVECILRNVHRFLKLLEKVFRKPKNWPTALQWMLMLQRTHLSHSSWKSRTRLKLMLPSGRLRNLFFKLPYSTGCLRAPETKRFGIHLLFCRKIASSFVTLWKTPLFEFWRGFQFR